MQKQTAHAGLQGDHAQHKKKPGGSRSCGGLLASRDDAGCKGAKCSQKRCCRWRVFEYSGYMIVTLNGHPSDSTVTDVLVRSAHEDQGTNEQLRLDLVPDILFEVLREQNMLAATRIRIQQRHMYMREAGDKSAGRHDEEGQ